MPVWANTKRKLYPNGFVREVVCSAPVFRLYFDASEIPAHGQGQGESKPKDMTNIVRDDSLKRAREKIYDIAALNRFAYFITWTLDGSRIDRYNVQEVKRKLQKFLTNAQQRYGMSYLIVPELHQDGAIHMHGLISGDMRMVDSGHVDDGGHIIYNMPQWVLGFSTAIRLYGSSQHVAAYITKYCEKDFKKIFGKFYYSSRDLLREVPTEYTYIDYDEVNAQEYRRVYGYKYVGYRREDQDDE